MEKPFRILIREFFYGWLVKQRNLSQHTIRSYRDTWHLYLQFVSKKCGITEDRLELPDLSDESVLDFLEFVEKTRCGTVGTRNCRLAAIKSFFRYVSGESPTAIAQCHRIFRIPTKKTVTLEMCYMEKDEVAAVLRMPDRTTDEGFRDYVLLSLLFNTGIRIQEALNLCLAGIRLETPPQITVLGKGGKERTCPIWPETAKLIKDLIRRQPRAADEPFFVNRYGQPLTASGCRWKLCKYVDLAKKQQPSLQGKNVTPHTFRHSAGVHLLEAGVDITVIRALFGHSSITTTARYARASIETKRRALALLAPNVRPVQPPDWQRDVGVLNWLKSL